MPRNTKIVNLSLPLSLYEEITKIAQAKGHSKSQVLREALRELAREGKIEGFISEPILAELVVF